MNISIYAHVARRLASLSLILSVGILSSVSFLGSATVAAQSNASSNADSPMLYFFTSAGCAPCIQVKRNVAELAGEGYPVTTIDVNERPDWANSFRVTRTPTVVLVQANTVQGYQPGQMRLAEMKDWFARLGYRPSQNNAATEVSAAPASQARVRPAQTKVSLSQPRTPKSAASRAEFRSETMHNGTDRPANEIEALALDSTVRLRVDDTGGSSYATGTAIHHHNGETLVMTCGHVFRESQGKGKISAEFGFASGRPIKVAGQLLDYDAGANDIALVVIQSGQHELPTVNVAISDSTIERGDRVFSLGCDNGEAPTIRNTAIKNLALYDGSLKYDIFGRPVNGRSGGGLFNDRGELIGICNAAAVEVDEGVYTALEVMHKQLAKTNLDHLFQPNRSPAARPATRIAANLDSNLNSSDMVPIRRNARPDSRAASNSIATVPPARSFQSPATSPVQNVSFEQAVSNLASDQEVIITIRSRSNPLNSRTITISDPTPKLLDYLGNMSDGQSNQRRSLNVASYRQR